MSRKHSTLLKEEVDDDENGSGPDGKKREITKDGEHRKKKAYKKGDKNEGYYNDSMNTKSTAVGGAAVNPSAESVASPVHTQQPGGIPQQIQQSTRQQQVQNQPGYISTTVGNMQGYNVQGQAPNWQQQPHPQTVPQRLPPPPGTHAPMGQPQFQQMQTSPPLPQAQYVQQNTQRQVYQAPPSQQGQNYQPPPPQQGQNYQPPPPQQHGQQGQVYQAPSPQGQNFQPPPPQQQIQIYQAPPPQAQGFQGQQGQNYQAPPPQQGQNYQAPPPQQGQNFQAPPSQQGQNYQAPPPQQGQNYQAPPSQQGQNYQAPPSQGGYYAVVQYSNQVPGYQAGGIVHTNMVHGQPIPHAKAPQSPTGQTHAHDPNWQQYNEGNWTSHPGDSTWTGPVPDQQRDGNWAAFDGSPTDKPQQQRSKSVRKEITWKESPDNSSSDEEIESHDDDGDDEEQQGLIRPPSPSKSCSSIEEEHDDSASSPWQIQLDQYDYYTKQFKRLQPNDGGVIKGPKARDFFLKSNLSTEILSKVWHLSDINQDNALDLDEFCIAMHLVVAIRHGLDLPAVLPYELLHHRQIADDLQTEKGRDDEDRETTDEPIKPLNKVRRNRSQSDTSLNEDHHPEIISRKTSVPTARHDDDVPLSPDPKLRIPRPKASNISLIDARPGQLLPPPLPGTFPSWTPTKPEKDDSDSAESVDDDSERSSDEEEDSRPLSPGQTAPPISMPPLTENEPREEDNEEGVPTPPSTPKDETPEPIFPDAVQVTRRLSRKSMERPRSAGDVNDIAPPTGSDSSNMSTPTNSSIGSDGKKEPPPPPPRRKEKGHSRSSSLDLNKLFGPKAKENRANTFGSSPSSQSSQTSQSGDVPLPLKTEQKPTDQADVQPETSEETTQNTDKPAKEENFADFSNFENLVKAQGVSSESRMTAPQGRTHRRSMSLDQAQDYVPRTSHPSNVDSTVNGPTVHQDAVPRPVPKLKPPVSPPVKLLPLNKQTPRKEGGEERRLKTEPPKVVVKPLTKESKLQNSIRELKETNVMLSRLNSELQQENKEMMEQRISLEVKLERLKPFNSKENL